MTKPFRCAIIGAGNIATGAYLPHLTHRSGAGQSADGPAPFPEIEVAAIADLDADRAQTVAKHFGVARGGTVDELFADTTDQLALDAIINLTIPAAHADVSLRAIDAGLHVYVEKPLAATATDGRRMLAAAALKTDRHGRSLRIACAPDTVLGAGHQHCRQLIDDGSIGRPVAATALMVCPGHEIWHPDPQFYYRPGGGPMHDMGPYYLAALTNMLGPVRRVTAITGTQISPRTVARGTKAGQTIDVQTPDHVAATLEMTSGCIATVIMSFAGHFNASSPITVFGTDGTLHCPDPNNFEGPVRVRTLGDEAFQTPTTPFKSFGGRGLGVADLARAINTDTPHRCDGHRALAALEVMEACLESSSTGKHIDIAELENTAPRPDAMPLMF